MAPALWVGACAWRNKRGGEGSQRALGNTSLAFGAPCGWEECVGKAVPSYRSALAARPADGAS